MRFAVLSHNHSCNFGDDIQSVAAARLLPRVDCAIPREGLHDFRADEKHLLVMNAFLKKQERLPPSDCIVPLWISFHIAKGAEKHYTTPEWVAHFNKWGPVGCRDRHTADILRQAGVNAFYSKCLTLTFPKRDPAIAKRNILFVDAPHWSGIKKRRAARLLGAENLEINSVSAGHNISFLGNEFKMTTTEKILAAYQTAGLVITSRLHCALPCVAMGVPVLYFGVREYRTEILADIGITMHPPLMPSANSLWQQWIEKRRFRGFDWTGETPDIESEKAEIISAFNAKLSPFVV